MSCSPVSPVPLQDNIQLSSTGVVREPLQLGPLNDRADRAEGSNDTPSPTAFGNQQREKPLGLETTSSEGMVMGA